MIESTSQSLVSGDKVIKDRAIRGTVRIQICRDTGKLKNYTQNEITLFHNLQPQVIRIAKGWHDRRMAKLAEVSRWSRTLSKKMILAAVIEAIQPQLSVSEFQRLSTTLADHTTALAERYRQELSPMLMYIRRMAAVLTSNDPKFHLISPSTHFFRRSYKAVN